jgi:Ring finger domain
MSIQNINTTPVSTFDEFIRAMNLEKEFDAETIVAENIVAEIIECPICMDPIDGNKNSVVTDCGHKFHCSCLMKNSCHNGFDCPMCRAAMVEDMEDDDEEEEEEEHEYNNSMSDYSEGDDNSETDEYDDEIHEIVIEDFDSLVEDICFYTNADFRRYPAENSVMIMLKITGNEDLMDDFDRHVVGEHTERILKLIDIYKRTRVLNDHFKKQAEKVSQRKEQEMFAQEDVKIEFDVSEKPVMTVDESIQKIKHVLKEISELNSYEFNLMKQVTPEIFHNKHKRTNISDFLRTLNLNNPRIGKNVFTENKNLIDEALNLLECKEKNE